LVFEDKLDAFDDFVHQLVGNVTIDGVTLALHRVFDAVLDSQESEQEEEKVVQALLAGLFLVFGELNC
jgi:hypothetical protein